jgi:hypothetical protein
MAKWLLSFLEYDFTIVYKPGKTHVVTYALPRFSDITKPTSVPNQTTNATNQTTNANLFYTGHEWLNDVMFF